MSRFTSPTPTRGAGPSHSPPDVYYAPNMQLARGLGWFSIGLGLAELLLPGRVGQIANDRLTSVI